MRQLCIKLSHLRVRPAARQELHPPARSLAGTLQAAYWAHIQPAAFICISLFLVRHFKFADGRGFAIADRAQVETVLYL